MIAKYSVEWVKDVINDFESILNLKEGIEPQRMERFDIEDAAFNAAFGDSRSYGALYVLHGANDTLSNSVLINQDTGEKAYVEKSTEGINTHVLITDTRIISLFIDAFQGSDLQVSGDGFTEADGYNYSFCRVYNKLVGTWQDQRAGKTITWTTVTKLIHRNIARFEIDNKNSEEHAKTIKNEMKFLLRREEEGFIYKNRYFSTELKGAYKLTRKQYFIIQHLYDAAFEQIHGRKLKKMVVDSLFYTTPADLVRASNVKAPAHESPSDIIERIKNNRWIEENQRKYGENKFKFNNTAGLLENTETLPGPVSRYFSDSKKRPVANLFGELIHSSGYSGRYRLTI